MADTPMNRPVSHMELCRALHALHKATLNGSWIFQPISVSLNRRDAEIIYVAYLEERLYLFRKGNEYRMAYGSNPHEAMVKAFAPAKPVRKREKHYWHVSSYSPQCGWLCDYRGESERIAKEVYLEAKKGATRVSVSKDGEEFKGWKEIEK